MLTLTKPYLIFLDMYYKVMERYNLFILIKEMCAPFAQTALDVSEFLDINPLCNVNFILNNNLSIRIRVP